MKRSRFNWMILALACVGCEDGGPLRYGGEGTIAGVVRMGGTPFEASIRATRVTNVPGDASFFEASVGPDGSYAIDVPAGRYVVGLRFEDDAWVKYDYSIGGLRFGDAPPDTLRVDSQNSPTAIDFDLSGLRAHFDLPAPFEETFGYIRLHRQGPRSLDRGRLYVNDGIGDVQGGVLDITVTGVLPGNYRVEVVIGYGDVHFWIPGVLDSTAAAWIEVPANTTAQVTSQLDTEPARIQGRISGAWLDFGIEPPQLLLFTPDSSFVRAWDAGRDGSFDEAVYFPGPVKLLVNYWGIHQWIGGQSFADATVFALEPGRTISGITFVQSGMLLEVTIPFSNALDARFHLYDAATLLRVHSWHGLHVIPNLRPGTYRMQIEAVYPGREAWLPQWVDRVSDPAHARVITIGQPGEVVRVPIVFEKGGTIAGTVREVQGITADYSFYITRADERTRWGNDFAFEEVRTFMFQGLPDGDWKVGAWRHDGSYSEQPPANTVWYPGTTDWEAATIITTRDHEDITGIEIVMPGDP